MKIGFHLIPLVDEENLLPPKTPSTADAAASARKVAQVGAPVKMLRPDIEDETREKLRGVFIDGSPDRSLPVQLGCLHNLIFLQPMLRKTVLLQELFLVKGRDGRRPVRGGDAQLDVSPPQPRDHLLPRVRDSLAMGTRVGGRHREALPTAKGLANLLRDA